MERGVLRIRVDADRSVVHNRLRQEAGFGLLELLMAMTILNIGILAVVGAFNSGAVALRRSGQISTATVLADKQMELYRALTYGSIALDPTSIPATTPYTSDPAPVAVHRYRPSATRASPRPGLITTDTESTPTSSTSTRRPRTPNPSGPHTPRRGLSERSRWSSGTETVRTRCSRARCRRSIARPRCRTRPVARPPNLARRKRRTPAVGRRRVTQAKHGTTLARALD